MSERNHDVSAVQAPGARMNFSGIPFIYVQ